MGEVEEQRYICKICSKSCVSGKSLGGHMRVHLAQISSSSKKAAQEKGKSKVDFDDHERESGSYQYMNQEKISNLADCGDGDHDQSNSYELRENPKKSWKISDPKHGLIKREKSCEECGKGFASLRALSGHMRWHSIKNKKEVHYCKQCGRGFASIRAMFGHMKRHSKRVKRVSNVDESFESLSEFDHFCPVRRKRSRIRYNCSVSQVDEAEEEAAESLLMLSTGVGKFLKLDLGEECDDDSAYFGSCRSKKSCGIGDFEKNVDEFDELDLKCVSDFVCDDGKNGVDTFLISEKCEENQDFLLANGDESFLENNSRQVGFKSRNIHLPLGLGLIKSKQHECPICFKPFPSGRALGGHKRAHYNGLAERKKEEVGEAREKLDLNFPISTKTSLSLGFEPWLVDRLVLTT